MFADIITSLKNGRLPDLVDLRKKFNFALTKKMGVINLPYHFWQNDPKINPPATHLLWAALLLEDRSSVAEVIGIIQKEAEESLAASSSKKNRTDYHRDLAVQIQSLTDDFLAMAPTQEFKQILATRCNLLNNPST